MPHTSLKPRADVHPLVEATRSFWWRTTLLQSLGQASSKLASMELMLSQVSSFFCSACLLQTWYAKKWWYRSFTYGCPCFLTELAISLNTFCLFAGVGILSIPYALSQGGWLSLLIFMTIAIICFYTGILLQRCIDSSSLVKTYPDIGELAFGRKGKIIVAIFLYLELYLVSIDFLILEGDNLEKLFPNANFHVASLKIGSEQGFVLIFSLLVLPTTWLRTLNMLAYVAIGGVMASVILIASVLWVGVFDGVGFHEKGVTVNWSGMPTAMSLYAFCFSGHAVFPMIYTGMRNRKTFPTVSKVDVLSPISFVNSIMNSDKYYCYKVLFHRTTNHFSVPNNCK